MLTFAYHRATGIEDAISAAARGARYYAGGTNMLDLMKTGVETRRRSSTSETSTSGRCARQQPGVC